MTAKDAPKCCYGIEHPEKRDVREGFNCDDVDHARSAAFR